jgi:hypothetical protein
MNFTKLKLGDGMRKAEYTLQYRIVGGMPEFEDFHAIVEVSCVTELTNLAHAALRTSHADNVNFNFIGD